MSGAVGFGKVRAWLWKREGCIVYMGRMIDCVDQVRSKAGEYLTSTRSLELQIAHVRNVESSSSKWTPSSQHFDRFENGV